MYHAVPSSLQIATPTMAQAMASKPVTDAQVLPDTAGEGDVKDSGPQVLPGVEAGDDKGDDAQVLPSEPGAFAAKDAGAQVLPGAGEDIAFKDAGPQVLPQLDDDAFLPMLPVESGREWSGLMLRVGTELEADFGPPRARPVSAGSVLYQPNER